MSKGSTPRPITDRRFYLENFDRIFGRKYIAPEADYEQCPYCGIRAEEICDSPPADICERAITKVYGTPITK